MKEINRLVEKIARHIFRKYHRELIPIRVKESYWRSHYNKEEIQYGEQAIYYHLYFVPNPEEEPRTLQDRTEKALLKLGYKEEYYDGCCRLGALILHEIAHSLQVWNEPDHGKMFMEIFGKLLEEHLVEVSKTISQNM